MSQSTIEVIKVPVGSAAYNEVVEFLYTEAKLLDDNRLSEWLELFGDEVSYRAPVRSTVARSAGTGFATNATYFDENRMSLGQRVARSDSPNDWAEQPPSRTHRIISNVLVEQAGEQLQVSSSVLLLRSRWDLRRPDVLSAKRADVLTRIGDGLRISSREVLVDQTNMETPNLGVFF